MPTKRKTTKQAILEAKLNVLALEEQYATQVYFETMPEYGPMYKYCFSTSNMTIPYPMQDVDAWLRAVIKHMATRREGHGGAYTDAKLISIPVGLSEAGIEKWLEYVTSDLRKRALRSKKKEA